MDSATKVSSRAVRLTFVFGTLLKIVVIILSNLILGTANPSDVAGVWTRYVPSLIADLVIGGLYVYFHMQKLAEPLVRADVGGKGGFISSLAIHAATGVLAIVFGLCGTIFNIGDPSHEEGLTNVAVGLMNLWYSEYRIVLTSRGSVILIGSMLSAIVGTFCTFLLGRAK